MFSFTYKLQMIIWIFMLKMGLDKGEKKLQSNNYGVLLGKMPKGQGWEPH